MNILHVIPSLSLGGAEKMLVDITNLSQNIFQEHKYYILSKVNNNQQLLRKINNNVTVEALKYNRLDIRNVLDIYNFIKKNDIDIVHAHLFPSLYWCAISSILLNKKIKFFYTEHSTNNKRRKKKANKIIEKYIYSKYDNIICISNGTKTALLDWLGDNFRYKVKLVYNGIFLNHFFSNKKFDLSRINLTMVSNFSPQKDQKTVIKALSLLPENYTLTLVGKGKNLEECREYAIKLNLLDRVIFTGQRDDVPQILSNSDVVIQSSHWEGFGLAAVEGMASGNIALVSNISGLNEVVPSDQYCFPKGDATELSKMILNMTATEESYLKFQSMCAIRSKDFSIRNTVLNYNKIYNDLSRDESEAIG